MNNEILNKERIHALVEQYQPMAKSIGMRTARNLDRISDAEDMAQEGLLRFYQGLQKNKTEHFSNLDACAATLIRYGTQQHNNNTKRFRRTQVMDPHGAFSETVAISSLKRPDLIVMEKEMKMILAQAMATLGEQEREIVRQFIDNNMKMPGHLQSHAHYGIKTQAFQKLRKYMCAHGYTLGKGSVENETLAMAIESKLNEDYRTANRLRSLRREHGFKLYNVHKGAGVCSRHVEKYEQCIPPLFNIKFVAKLSNLYSTSIDYALGLSPERGTAGGTEVDKSFCCDVLDTIAKLYDVSVTQILNELRISTNSFSPSRDKKSVHGDGLVKISQLSGIPCSEMLK